MFFFISHWFSLGGHQSILLSGGESDLVFTSLSFDAITEATVLRMPRTAARNLGSGFHPGLAFVGSISRDIPCLSSTGEQPTRWVGGDPTAAMPDGWFQLPQLIDFFFTLLSLSRLGWKDIIPKSYN
ncbi:unnamed protein product [Linum trigynum]|uniref:Uncharacterized protein n=1 Tax=Linum trigynum TaxID=586398 RepID=A0AAV2FR68_9ROSI